MMPFEKLKELRFRSGLRPDEVAASVGISSAEYYDLEAFDDLTTATDLGVLAKLAKVLNIRLSVLFSENIPDGRLAPAELASLLAAELRTRKINLGQAEEEIGWTLGPFLQDPNAAILTWNITCLQDVCKVLKRDWLSVLNSFDTKE